MKFVVDVMLGSLARHLRLRGYDVWYSPSLTDNDILQIALEQERIILTRDTGLAARPLAKNSILITSDDLNEQLRQIEQACPAESPTAALTRCSRCNRLLEAVPKERLRDLVPEQVLQTKDVFQRCPGCERIYWEGSHVKRMKQDRRK